MRKTGFYPHLALTNILRNGQFYLPYFLTCSATVAMFYILCFLAYNDMIDTMPGAGDVRYIMYLGCIVVGLFSVIIISYTNSFIMKRRHRELGLYNILGMEKQHIARLLCCESVILGTGSILCGLALGILLSKLILLLLFKLVHFTVKMGFNVSGKGILATALLFAAIFVVILLKNLFHLSLSKPVELLHSTAAGEREPKTKWLIAILGILTLGSGYVIANVVKSPLDALLLFFVAVILVIIGTYCLFTAGSIAILKRLRANKRFYYQANHFTAVSGLLYRMKQNAVGLASICILSTMVLVTVSTTVCLYFGSNQVLETQYPTDISVSVDLPAVTSKTAQAETLKKVEAAVKQSSCEITSLNTYIDFTFAARLKDNELLLNPEADNTDLDLHYLQILTAAEYNHMTENNITLAEDQVLCYSLGTELPEQFRLGNRDFTIAQRLPESPFNANSDTAALMNDFSMQYVVVANDQVRNAVFQIQKKAYGEDASTMCYSMDFDLSGNDKAKLDCYQQIMDLGLSGRSRQDAATFFYATYGGFLFLGLFLGLLFLMATVLIIYYKQISEGYEDQRRFEIMQKVGMTEKEVRRSIRSQILLVFFLPLIVAGIHILAAFNLIRRLLILFSLTNVTLFALCTAGTFLIFGIIYALVYWRTARTYYKIVQAKQ